MDKKPIQEEPEHITKEVATEVVEANRVERGQGESEDSFLTKKSVAFIAGILILFGLYLSSLYNYLLFHSLAEIFSIVVAWAIFILAWNSRRIMDNNYLLFIGIAYLFIGDLDLVHTLGYSGMGIFHGYATNLPTQLWIASRYMESLSLLIAPLFLTRRLRADLVLMIYALVTALVLGSVFYWHIFPTCFVEGVGLTPFKKISEYIISIILIGAITVLFQKRKEFDERVFRLLVASIAFTIASELAFTFYISAYGFSNLVGHYFKIISFYLIYKAIIETGLTRPYTLLFRNLKQREEALRESEEKYRSMMEAMKDPVYICSSDYRVEYMNPTMIRRTGRDAIGEHCFKVLHGLDEKCPWCMHDRAEQGEYLESEIVSPKDNRSYHVSQSSIVHEDGSISKVTVFRDTTDIKTLEDQFRQAQKMEAVGRLAGGVAHDFNNLLTTIIGYADLMLIDLAEDHPFREKLEQIGQNGKRAARLTRQLLAFSRKQILQPVVLDLNELIKGFVKMLDRLIGEDVELETVLVSGLRLVEADPGQMEQIIMNLVINARDAMPDGGKVIIETANTDLDEDYAKAHDVSLQPGPYLMLAVSDTGTGMDEETRSNIFEPFFTTKEVGKGTGLGLSTVYGIAKQSGGYIWVYSEPGQGTTFKIYLPAVAGEAVQGKKEQPPADDLTDSETILIVEDDDMLRNLAREILQLQGYRILEAENGIEALRISEEHGGQIHLMITDVVMPKMGGKKVADRLQPIYPLMKVIYMSGYTDNSIAHHCILAPGLNFLQKPFSPEVLARKVREVLDKKQD